MSHINTITVEGTRQDQPEDHQPVSLLRRFYWRPIAEVREFFAVLLIIRFSAVVSILGSLAILLPDQALEALRVMAEDRSQTYRPLVLFALTTLLFGVMSWYWARILLYLFRPYVFRERKTGEPKIRYLGRWAAWQAPRFFGVLPVLAAARALQKAAAAPSADSTNDFLLSCAYIGYAAAALLYILFVLRGRLLHSKRPVPAETHGRGRVRCGDLRLVSWALLLLSVALSLVLFVVFTKTHGQAGCWFGTTAVIMLAMSSFIPLGSIAVWLGRVAHIPLTSLFLIAVVVFNALDLNDNHMIRHNKIPRPPQQPEFEASFDEWLRSRADRAEYDVYPVFIVSAEGGGLRAAYFSAMVLATIQDRCPAFAQHVFAVSGVSGGSLGASVFAALSSRKAKNEAGQRCEFGGGGSEWADKSDAVLRRDFLSPLIASALYPDLMQRALPYPASRLDRALALEVGLEDAWVDAFKEDGQSADEFGRSFYKLWDDFPREATPALFLNTTRVETGERMVISNLFPLDDERFNQLTPLAYVGQQKKNQPDKEMLNMTLSTAACLSARFPIVTPSGYLPVEWWDAAGKHYAKQRYVDGGYFENSGTATVFDILAAMHVGEGVKPAQAAKVRARNKVSNASLEEEEEEKEEPAQKFWPIVIRISNSPRPAAAGGRAAPAVSKYRLQGLDEILSPILPLLNTREARGDTAVRQLRTAVNTLQDKGSYATMVDFELSEDGIALPLGWLLSESARGNMRSQLGSPKQCPPGKMVGNDCQAGRVIWIMGAFKKLSEEDKAADEEIGGAGVEND
jgi:predicted acylesterase/phospholipase RssA